MKNLNGTMFSVEGYYSKEVAENIKKKMTGKTYLNFEIVVSGIAGNYCISVATKSKGTSVKELKGMFYFALIQELGNN